MQAIINGETRQFDAAPTLLDLIRSEGLEGRRVAIEVNGEIVPRSRHAETGIRNGDRIEIVHAIGGG
jgi:sulfur carrier protein